jgi:hypothetical protein
MLDEYSRRFAEVFFTQFPEWRDAATIRRDHEGRAYLHIRLARPINGDPVGGLAISTENDEVTIECGRHWHGHFDWEPSDQLSSEVFAFLAEVFSEKQVFVRFEHRGGVVGGTKLDADMARDIIANRVPQQPLHPRFPVMPDTLSLWSWRGTFDKTVRR